MQVLDGIMEFENQGIGQLPDIVKAPLRTLRLLSSYARLVENRREPCQQRHHRHRCCDYSGLVTQYELGGSVAQRILLRTHRQILQVAANVSCKLLH